MQLKLVGKQGTKKGRPATMVEDILVLALIVLVAVDLVIALGVVLWGLNG